MRISFISLALLGAVSPAQASTGLSLTSSVFVERTEVRDGKPHIILAEPDMVTPGDQLVFVLHYRNQSNRPAANMVVTNPLPAAVSYQEADGAQVSVDGGKSWGTLSTSRVRSAAGSWRAARPGDVTHIRWQLAGNVPAGAGGRLKFRGTVR